MLYWEWEASMDTGIESIDEQHRKIVDLINTLGQAVEHHDRQKTLGVLEELEQFTLTHFSFEEFLMENGNYPAFESHKQVHQRFAGRIAGYKESCARGEDISRKLLQDLKVWLTNHIQRDDQDYAPYVKKKLNKGWISRTIGKFF